MFAALAILRHGVRTRLIAALVGALAISAIGGLAQLQPPSQEERLRLAALLERPKDFQTCEERRGVTYCAYPAYVRWIDRWARPVEAVLDQVPRSARPSGVVIRQTLGPFFEGMIDVPAQVLRRVERRRVDGLLTGIEWGRSSAEGEYEIGLSLSVAARAVGLPIDRRDIVLTPADVDSLSKTLLPQFPKHDREGFARRNLRVGRQWSTCHTLGQARAAVAVWLAGQATPATKDTVERVADASAYGLLVDEEERRFTYLGPFSPLYPAAPPDPDFDMTSWSDAEFRYAAQLLRWPDDAVGSAFRTNWAELTRPATDTKELLDLFDLTALPTIHEQVEALPDDFKTYGGIKPRGFIGAVIPCR
jgi:ribosomal protein L13E